MIKESNIKYQYHKIVTFIHNLSWVTPSFRKHVPYLTKLMWSLYQIEKSGAGYLESALDKRQPLPRMNEITRGYSSQALPRC